MYNIEIGGTKPSLPTLIVIANILDTSVNLFLYDNVVKSGYVFKKETNKLWWLWDENNYEYYLSNQRIFKTRSLKEYICKNIPEMNIQSINEKIEDILPYDEIDLNKFDLIISTTGNHNVNRWLNTYVCNHKFYVPIIYAWNEVCGIGNHVAYFKYGNVGCYECLFGRNDDTGELYDKTSYCKFGQKITKTVYGCDKSFVPYGNMISLKTVLICMDIIKDI